MRRLVDGAFAVVAAPPQSSQVRSTQHARHVTVGPDHHAELLALCHGIPDGAPAGPAFRMLQAQGFAGERLAAEDADIMARLEALGQGFRWHVRGLPRGDALCRLLRGFHSRRKVNDFEYGQTAVLPECGVARCWELTRRTGKKKRVLVLGDDDLLSPILAQMGHSVTMVDIDPAVVDLAQRCAAELGVKVDARVQDLAAPWPADLTGRFDAVLTDPMSYEKCLEAFLARAANAAKPGSQIFCCVHPVARPPMQRVTARLGLGVEEVLLELSAYYFQGFVENWYRSDLFALRVGKGPPVHAADKQLPFKDFIRGSLSDRLHGFTDVRTMPLRKAQVADVTAALDYLQQQTGGTAFVAAAQHDTEHWHHAWRALSHGGHLAVTLDKQKGTVSYDLYPFQVSWDQALVGALTQRLRLAHLVQFNAMPPDVGAPTPVVVAKAQTRARPSRAARTKR